MRRPQKNIRKVRYQTYQIHWKLVFKMLFVFFTCCIIVNQCESNRTLKYENKILQFEIFEKDSIIDILTIKSKPIIEKKIDFINIKTVKQKIVKQIVVVVDTIIPIKIINDTL